MSAARWSIDKWQDLLRMLFRPEHASFFPHKVFRWDTEGIYRDCFFPFQCEHLLGGDAVLGKSAKEVLPKNVGYMVQKALRSTLRRGVSQDIQCVLHAGKQCYVASVRLFPYDSEILGFVTDHDLTGKPVIQVTPTHPSIGFLKHVPKISSLAARFRRKQLSNSDS